MIIIVFGMPYQPLFIRILRTLEIVETQLPERDTLKNYAISANSHGAEQ